MARYYYEKQGKQIIETVMQDDTGIYRVVNNKLVKTHDKEISMPVDAPFGSLQYFDYVRKFERSSFWDTKPTEIMEIKGTAAETFTKIAANQLTLANL